METFGPTSSITIGNRERLYGLAWVSFTTAEGAAKAINCKNLVFDGRPKMMVPSNNNGAKPHAQAHHTTSSAFAFIDINNIDACSCLSPENSDAINLNIDSAASSSLRFHPAFSKKTCKPTIWSGISGGHIVDSSMKCAISGTTDIPVVYTTPPVEHAPDATHNLLSVSNILPKNRFSVLFDHTDMSPKIGHFPIEALIPSSRKQPAKVVYFPSQSVQELGLMEDACLESLVAQLHSHW
ncbi:hypothetical protein BC830DRAFT_1172213 [Chytriomyces sp. MP71]|nr:hypothetical protein BC830DRAFT_1172213 [Chytriomyces sp. MP71]